MNIKAIGTVSFLAELGLVTIPVGTCFVSPGTPFGIKLVAVLGTGAFFVITRKFKGLTTERLLQESNEINEKLRAVDIVKSLTEEQRVRSNVFRKFLRSWKYHCSVYRPVYMYNMETFDDKNIVIPKNMGCTGRAWDEQVQRWGTKPDFGNEGSHRLPPEEFAKVPKDLEWVCSTPIIDQKGKVRAVLNFDGNRSADEQQRKKIQEHAHRVADEIKNIILRYEG